MAQIRFPETFLFGAATSAHQVEGNNLNSDWWQWEHSPGRIRQLQSLGKDPKDFISVLACDHYRRFREDLDLAQSLHHNAHRFSVEWARIEPEEGKWNLDAIAHYREVLEALRERNIEPIVTLHHFTNPLWFAQRGGWANKYAVHAFERYVTFVAEHLGDLAQWWVTINEPKVIAIHGYLVGDWPPQKQNPYLALRVFHRLAHAHRAAYRILHANAASKHRRVHVGLAYNCRAWFPLTESWADRKLASLMTYRKIKWFLNRVKNDLDFIGINYYTASRIGLKWNYPIQRGCDTDQKSDVEWDICPKGLRTVLETLWSAYRLPLLITENGLADADDSRRAAFVQDHLAQIAEALNAGITIQGYLHWSLLDNFEWASGFAPRFGLVAVDYATQKRTVRPSARLFAGICKTRTLPTNPNDKILMQNQSPGRI